ncbi:polymer-forming cytoskeletal protein [Flavobacteriales bacterium]|jgi:cytoskeletal protein CcmA (bactofilin family)|nr:polymer-forming cytoskeletal protein [Flavobacteriales bacterium]
MVFKSDRSMINSNNQSPDRLNRIVEGTHIEGDIKSDSNIRIDGYVKGTISVKGRLVLGPTGKIDGDIKCKNADLEGKLNGTIEVDELLSLKSTAKLQGEISTNKLAIEPGAIFSGNCKMGAVLKDLTSADDARNVEHESLKEKTA